MLVRSFSMEALRDRSEVLGRLSLLLFFLTKTRSAFGCLREGLGIYERELYEGLCLASGLLVLIPRLVWGENYMWE